MAKRNTAALFQPQRKPTVVWGTVVAGLVIAGLVGFFILGQGEVGDQPLSAGAAANINENDVAALQAAERGALGSAALVWFHAPWCEICHALKRAGTVTALESEYRGRVRVVMVDISTASGEPFVSKYRVFGTPTWVLFDAQGQVATQFSGWPGAPAVAQAFDRVLAIP